MHRSSAAKLEAAAAPASEAANDGYVDPAVCSSCHGNTAESFGHTGMGRSLYLPNTSNRVEDYSVNNSIYNQRSGTYYKMVERGGAFYQQRYQIGPGGGRINEWEERVDYVIGSGDQARSYLHRGADGRLIELPVTWYTERRGKWGMTPGYDQRRQEDFHGPISYSCLFCHDAYPRTSAGPNVRESGEPIFPATIPKGIDCQRCHGPGRAHAEAAASGHSSISEIKSSIVNPARLSRERQLEVCMECHLSTSGSQDENVSRRFGRDVFSYRPGQPLADYKLYFDQPESAQRKSKFDIVDAAYRLSFSACFRKSSMTCLSCHDPHVEEHGRTAEARYVKICEGCHQGIRHAVSLPANANCVSCHMPKRRSQFAVHIVLTDHYIQRNMPAGDLTAPIEEPENKGDDSKPEESKLVLFYPKQLSGNREDNLYLAAAQLKAAPGDKTAIGAFEQLVEQIKPAEGEFYDLLGEAYAAAGNASEAEKWLEEANRRKPGYRPMVEHLVEILFSEGKFEQAIELLNRTLATPPADSALLADLGNAYARAGKLEDAEAALKRAIAVNPETAQAYNLLGLIALRRDDSTQAEKNFREALRLQPDLAEADLNLGKLFIGNEDLKQAGYFLQRAIALDAADADAHHSFGAVLMLSHSYAAAAQEMRQAASLNPGDALTRSDLGDVLALEGQNAEAAKAYAQALAIDPRLPQANLGLGTLLQSHGQTKEARQYCELAAQTPDPSIRDAALRCAR